MREEIKRNLMLLKNKVAIVTGGSRGIGKEIVKEFANQGANVAFNFLKSEEESLNIKKEIESKGRKALIFKQNIKD